MQTVDDVIDQILTEEGSAYTDNPADSGGPTKYGITQAALAAWRGRAVTAADVQALTEDEARKIYLDTYYSRPGFASVATCSPAIAAKLTDAGVNVGTGTAATWLQRALNVLNEQGKAYSDIPADGKIGPVSIAALAAFLRMRGQQGEHVLLEAINCLQGAYYIGLAEQRQKDEAFIYGWILNRVSA